MEIKIDKRYFNKLFFDMSNDDRDHKRFLVSYGGAGSGKSYSITQREVIKCIEKKQKLLVIRKVQATLNDSCVDLFKTVLDNWQIPYDINITDKKIKLENGSEILFKGLDNPEKIKSIAGITRIWIEEVTELDQVDFDQINTRLRGIHAKGGQVTMSFNPVSELHWIKKVFFDTERDDVFIYHSTYKDNNFLDEEYGKQLEFYQIVDPNHYRVYALGEFGIVQTGNECYRYDITKNKQMMKDHYLYSQDETLYISIDENVNPYCYVCIFQMIDNKLVVLDELALEGKNIEETCAEFKRKYIHHNGGLIITGDASSRKQDVKIERGANFFTLIRGYLEDFNPTIRVMKKNENVYMRILFANLLFTKGEILIGPKAKSMSTDLQSVTWDKTGAGKDKSYATKRLANGETMRYQKWGHGSDCLDYAIQLIYKKEYYQFKNRTKPHRAVTSIRDTAKY